MIHTCYIYVVTSTFVPAVSTVQLDSINCMVLHLALRPPSPFVLDTSYPESTIIAYNPQQRVSCQLVRFCASTTQKATPPGLERHEKEYNRE